MDYLILSIDDSRRGKKDAIRASLSDWTERSIQCVNGHVSEELKNAKSITGVNSFPMRAGELGVWYSVVKAWMDIAQRGPAVVFEDDALLRDDFLNVFAAAMNDLPSDADFLTLFVPYNQAQDYYYHVEYDAEGVPNILATHVHEDHSVFNIGSQNVARAYMGYGNVAVYYTKSGAEKLLKIARERGTYTPVDCFLFLQTHIGSINGYALHPRHVHVVDVDWKADSLIHFGSIVEV